MIKQADVQGRLNLLRYGFIVVVVITFLVALLAPYALSAPMATELNRIADALEASGATGVPHASVQITDFLGQALLVTVVVAIVCIALYVVYSRVLANSTAKS